MTAGLLSRRLSALGLTLLFLGAPVFPSTVCPGAALAQSTDGMTIGPNLEDMRRKRELERQKSLQNTNSGQPGALNLQHTPSLSDLFPSMPLGLTSPQPISLEGIKIPGLNSKSVETLAYNQFIVVHGASFNYPTMADLYRDNRLTNKSNFISSDVVTHLYFVIMNTISLKVVEDHLCAEMENLLRELIDSCIHDYRACDIAEVKDDIQRNLSFIVVALKLLDPKAELPDMGGATDLAKTDLAAIAKGGKGHSDIFNRDQDFASLRPIGFYAMTPKASNFFRCAAWLSMMYFPLADVTNNSETGGGNTFRRSVLLYRALELGKSKDGSTLLTKWQRVNEIYGLITMGRLSREPSVYPRDLRAMFATAGKLDFKDLLYTLGQPLSRARLLLSIKNQRQLGLNATSIFEIDKPKDPDAQTLVFRFLPPITPYELDWLRYTVKDFRDDGTAAGQFVNPLSLYVMYAWGAAQASNILHTMIEHLDPSLYYGLGDMLRIEGRRGKQNDPNQAFLYPERRWSLISDYFAPVKKGAQAILYSDTWMTQRLSSASAALVDSLIGIDKSYKTDLVPSSQVTGSLTPGGPTTSGALTAAQARAEGHAAEAPVETAEGKTAAKPGAVASIPAVMAGPTAAARAASQARLPAPPIFHYLEPCPDYYRKLAAFVRNNESEMTRLGVFPEAQKSKCNDFVRLLERLIKICEREVAFEPLPAMDFRLLGSFDQVLAAVDSPLAGSVYIPGINGGGASLGLGDAGVCYIIFNTDKGPYLSRGAVYTYYEVAGGPFKNEHWERKKSFGFLRPSSWLGQFDFVQEGPVARPKDNKVESKVKDAK